MPLHFRAGPLALVLALSGCTWSDNLDGHTFACRSNADCAPGYTCDGTTQGCVAGAPEDAGASDAGGVPADSGLPDSGWSDSGQPDSGSFDAGWPDAGMPDSGVFDAGALDSGQADSGTGGCPPGGPDGIPNAVASWKLDETSGTTAADSSGNGNDATLVGTPAPFWTPGHIGGALAFPPPNAALATNLTPSLNVLGPFSVSFWLKTDGLNAVSQTFMLNKGTYPTFGWDVLDDGPFQPYVIFRVYPSTNEVVFDRALANDGGWHHIAGTYDGAMLIFYLDGLPIASNDAGTYAPDTTTAFFIGKSSPNGDGGLLDQIRFYARGLTPGEVACLAAE